MANGNTSSDTPRRILTKLQLNIGAGLTGGNFPRSDGWVNCDILPGPGIDLVFDCLKPWPIKPGSAIRVHSSHTLEHLSSHIDFFRHAFNAMALGGTLTIRVPYGWNSAAWWDPTHLRPWLPESFAFVQPGYAQFSRNLVEGDAFDFAYWIDAATLILSPSWVPLFKWRWLLRWTVPMSRHLLNVYMEVYVEMRKTEIRDPESVAFGGERSPMTLPTYVGAYRHHMDMARPGPVREIVILSGRRMMM